MAETQSNPTEKKGFFKDDRMLVCSMFAFYGLCILGLIVATFGWLNRRGKIISANATSTAFALATQQAKATRNATVRATEQAQYEFIDHFDSNKNHWLTGKVGSTYWAGDRRIKEGVYLWNVLEAKQPFIYWAEFLSPYSPVRDFDAYVDTKIINTTFGNVCSGFLFRVSPYGWDNGGYYFVLCDNSLVNISYHTKKDGWEQLVTIPYHGNFEDWNRLEIMARGTHFTFLVNGISIHEIEDDRQKLGGMALVIEMTQQGSAKIMFDNFGFQSR